MNKIEILLQEISKNQNGETKGDFISRIRTLAKEADIEYRQAQAKTIEGLCVWDGIEADLVAVDSIKDAKDYYLRYMEDGLIHPDIESVEILKRIGGITVTETDQTVEIDKEDVPICGYLIYTDKEYL